MPFDSIPVLMTVAAVVTACGTRPTDVNGPNASQLAVQSASAGGLRVIAFDAHDAIGAMLGVRAGMPTTALALPGGDWLVGFDGHIVARLSPDGTLRWNRELAIDRAVVSGDGLVVAANVAGDARSVAGVRGDGSVAWRVDGGSMTTRPRLVRTPAATIVAHSGGELAVDDSGVVLWRIDRRGERGRSAVAAYVEGAGVVVVHAAPAAPETAVLPRPRMPMVAELIDPSTGKVRARVELAPDADAWVLSDVAVAGNRVVVRATDAVQKFVVFSVGRDSIAVADAFVVPVSIEELARVPRIGRGEVCFLDAGPRTSRPLEITVVDPATRRVRRAPLIRVSEGGYVQLWHRHRVGDAFTFFGDLSGTLEIAEQRLRADVRKVRTMDGRMAYASLWFFGAFAP